MASGFSGAVWLMTAVALSTACGSIDPASTRGSEPADVVSSAAEVDPFVVDFVDLARYQGEWFEIASIPQSFQGFCTRTRALYEIIGDKEISVVNTCRVGIAPITIEGTARVVDEKSNGILEVSFKNIPRKGDYRIIALDANYQYALVTSKDRSSLFVLSRTRDLDAKVYSDLMERARLAGVDVSRVKKTPQ